MRQNGDIRKLLFVYNPASGRGQIRSRLFDMIDVFVKNGYQVIAYPTQCSGDARRVVKEREDDIAMVVCSGGDGTLDEVVSGMMESGTCIPIGYVPSGSTNDFAKSLGLPHSFKKATTAAMEGREFPCDIGQFNDDYFVYVAAFGMFTDVSYDTDQHMKNLLGHAAYIIEGAKRLPIVESYHFHIEYTDENDDVVELDDDYLLGMVTNSTSVGGFKNITGKRILLDDGVFEVTLIRKPLNPMDLIIISDAIDGRTQDQGLIVQFKAKKASFVTESPVAWALDGEYGGEFLRADMTNLKHAVSIMVP
ncbi:MAG: YegS/Rv2252/BmrU family lipid kinase [Lachnospiraceae bacterium]|nr:YegS/Rv2252/BmrU family lipid kinase [Lachnospiraceae bacterium]